MISTSILKGGKSRGCHNVDNCKQATDRHTKTLLFWTQEGIKNISFATSEEFMQESNPTIRLAIPYPEHAGTANKKNTQV
jgi:hypothetical protein